MFAHLAAQPGPDRFGDAAGVGGGLSLFAVGVWGGLDLMQLAGLVIAAVSAAGTVSREVRGWVFRSPK